MSGAALDMSLDDLIKKNKKSDGAGNSRGRGRSSGPGPARRIPNRNANRAAPYAPAKAPESSWQHDMFGGDGYSGASASRSGSIETGTKLYLSNLEYSVSNEDIKELFAEVGDLKRCAVHYDKSGRSKGTAEVVFSRRQDGMAAVKRYNNVQLDGKPMKIEIVGTNIVTPAPVAQSSNGASFGDANRAPRSGQGRGGYGGRSRGGGGGGGGRGRGFRRGGGGGGGGRGRGRGEKVSVSAEDLDADLESYHAEAMQTN